jgi:hypothetical protein
VVLYNARRSGVGRCRIRLSTFEGDVVTAADAIVFFRHSSGDGITSFTCQTYDDVRSNVGIIVARPVGGENFMLKHFCLADDPVAADTG